MLAKRPPFSLGDVQMGGGVKAGDGFIEGRDLWRMAPPMIAAPIAVVKSARVLYAGAWRFENDAALSAKEPPMTAAPTRPIKLYRFALSGHAHRAELFLSLLRLPFESIDVDLTKGEHKRPEFWR
jgi:hypothetical protein